MLMNVLQEVTIVITMPSVLTSRAATLASVKLVIVEMESLAQVSYACAWLNECSEMAIVDPTVNS